MNNTQSCHRSPPAPRPNNRQCQRPSTCYCLSVSVHSHTFRWTPAPIITCCESMQSRSETEHERAVVAWYSSAYSPACIGLHMTLEQDRCTAAGWLLWFVALSLLLNLAFSLSLTCNGRSTPATAAAAPVPLQSSSMPKDVPMFAPPPSRVVRQPTTVAVAVWFCLDIPLSHVPAFLHA